MKKYLILALILLIHLLFLSSSQFTAWPEMMSFPYLLQNGYRLYSDLVFVYTPVLPYLLLSAFFVFGYKLTVLKIITWALIIGNDIFIYLITKKLTKKYYPAVLGVLAYVLLQSILEGNMLWFDLGFVTPFLASLFLVLNKNYFSSGLALAAAILTKQIALIFTPVFLVFIFINKKSQNDIFKYVLGLVLPMVILIILLYLNKQLSWFVNWTLYYPMAFWSDFPGYVQLGLSRRQFLIFVLFLLPIISSAFFSKKTKTHFFLLGLLSASFIAFYPRFSFFHLQAFVAVYAIWVGFVFSKLGRGFLFLIFGTLALVVFIAPKNLNRQARFWNQDTFSLAQKLPQNTSVYYLNLPSQYYVLTNSLPPKPWVDNYGWYWEVPGFADKALSRWEQNKPEFIVRKDPEPGAWYELGTYEPQKLMNWIKSNYNKEVEIEKGTWLWKRK